LASDFSLLWAYFVVHPDHLVTSWVTSWFKNRQRERLCAQRIDGLVASGRIDEPQASQAPVNPPHHAVDLSVDRWSRRMEDEHVVRLADEDPVEHERVEVDVEIERPAEPLDARHHARFAAGEPHPFCLATICGAQRAHENAEHRPT